MISLGIVRTIDHLKKVVAGGVAKDDANRRKYPCWLGLPIRRHSEKPSGVCIQFDSSLTTDFKKPFKYKA